MQNKKNLKWSGNTETLLTVVQLKKQTSDMNVNKTGGY